MEPVKAASLVVMWCVWCAWHRDCVAADDVKCLQVQWSNVSERCLDWSSAGVSVTSSGGTLINGTNCGVLVPKELFEKEPRVVYTTANKEWSYTSVVCQGYEGTPGGMTVAHLRQDIQGGDLVRGDASSGTELLGYSGAEPLPGRGVLLRIHLVLRQRTRSVAATTPKVLPVACSTWMEQNAREYCGPLVGVAYRTRYRRP